jgi:hypothetical protein
MIARVVKYHSVAEWNFSLWFVLKANTKMKTTNLKQTSVAKPWKWFQRRLRWHDPREARPERSQFRD